MICPMTKSATHCLTELFPIYQNKHWTIRRRDNHSVDPSSYRIILKIVGFQNCLMDFVTFDWFCSLKWNNCFTFANGKKKIHLQMDICCHFHFCHNRRNSFGSSSNVTIEKWKRRTPSLLDRKLQEQKLRTLWPVFFYQIMLGEKTERML